MQSFLPQTAPKQGEEEEEGDFESNVDSIVSAWEAVDFHSVQDSLSDQMEQLINMEEVRKEQRKQIAKQTKEFRSTSGGDEEDEGNIKAKALMLIKLYQDSYESVSTEAKFGSNALLTAYKILRNLPDPAAAPMKQAANDLQQLSTRVRALEEREESLTNALRTAREKTRGMEELKQEREGFQHRITLDGEALLESERLKNQELMAMQISKFEDEATKLQLQVETAEEEIDRLKAINESLEAALQQQQSARPSREADLTAQLEAARTEGFASAQAQFLARITALTDDNEKVSRKFLNQIDMLQSHLQESMEQISVQKAELSTRPTVHEFENVKNQLAVISRLQQQPAQSNNNNDDALNTNASFIQDGGEDDTMAPEYLDGLSSFLLSTNQRLVSELQQAKDQLSALEAQRGTSPTRPTSPPLIEDDVTINSAALKAQRDRLRAKLEKRDLEIEQFTNKLEAQESNNRRLNDDMEKLRQRLRFLQSYKVSEKSTLLSGITNNEDMVESNRMPAPTPGLGQGVGHQFRNIYDTTMTTKLLSRKQRIALIALAMYICVLHLWVLYVIFLR